MRNVRALAVLAVVAMTSAGCKGDKGDPGATGGNGNSGQSALVRVTPEPAGANCAAGGTLIQSGLDANGNGTLDAAEVTSTVYTCNGSSGQASLVNTSPEPRGNSCIAGGVRIESGLDANGNGTLDAGEVTTTRFVCHGGGRDYETCAGCHSATLPEKHQLRGSDAVAVRLQHWSASGAPVLVGGVQLPAVSVDAVTNAVTVRFNVRVDGTPRYDFVTKAQDSLAHNEDAWWVYMADPATSCTGATTQAPPNDTGPAGCRTKITTSQWTLTHTGNGNYTGTITAFPAPPAAPPADGTVLMLSAMNPLGVTATAVATLGTPAHDVVSDQACINCHGRHVWRGANHDVTSPQGIGPCIVCHNRKGSADPRLPGAGSGLMGIVHGIHNSMNMPDKQYTFTWTNGNKFNFSLGFPGYTINCSTCHDSPARLAAVADAPLSYGLCISCHDSFASFPRAPVSHGSFGPTQACGTCHNGTGLPGTVSGYHNGHKTERNGLIWGGADQSVVEGEKFALAVTGVTRAGGNYQVTWTTSYNGAPVNPCNADFATGPVFLDATADAATGRSASNMQFLKVYGQGDDWVNAGRTGTVSPGQPAASATLTAAGATPNTTCAANVATSTIPVDAFATAGTRGAMALQGKPQLRFAPAAGTTGEIIQARAKSPTYNFVVPAADGAATAGAARRTIVDVDKCLQCHKGTLYQHGGNRVDSIDLCVTCHNPASSEGNNRVLFGVDATRAYDGKWGESYDMRTMTHAIHSAGESGRAYVVYRTRGIYFFGSQAALDGYVASRNWPTTGGVSCRNSEGATVTYFPVYGSTAGPNDRVPTVNTDGSCNTTTGPVSTVGVWQTHNVTLVHYPQALNHCGACHADGWVPSVPDATKSMAVTFDPGVAPWGNQLDDVVVGPTVASCMTCHQSGDDTTQLGLKTHGYDQSWLPTTFTSGRQTLIDSARKLPRLVERP